jgi:Mg-chelatase subunit ChlD
VNSGDNGATSKKALSTRRWWWKETLQWSEKLLQSLPISNGAMHFGTIQYGTVTKAQRNGALDGDSDAAMKALRQMLPRRETLGKKSQLDKGVRAAEKMFSDGRGGVGRVLIIVTDTIPSGGSNRGSPADVALRGAQLRGIKIVFVLVTNSNAVLRSAGLPQAWATRWIKTRRFSKLAAIQAKASMLICENAKTKAPVAPPAGSLCANSAKADVVLVLDSSASMDKKQWKRVQSFANGIISAFPIGPGQMHLGAVTFAKTAKRVDYGALDGNRERNLKEIAKLNHQKEGTSTNMHLAVRAAMSMFKDYGRRNVARSILLVTDGVPTGGLHPCKNKQCADAALKDAKARGIRVIFVVIDKANLFKKMPIPESWSPVPPIMLHNFRELRTVQDKAVRAICKQAGTLPPTLAPRCKCQTPGRGTSGKNRYACTDGTKGHCRSHEECFAQRTFTKGQWAEGCRKSKALKAKPTELHEMNDHLRKAAPTHKRNSFLQHLRTIAHKVHSTRARGQ